MAQEKTYCSKDSKSYVLITGAHDAIKKAQLRIGGECTYMVAPCLVSGKFVPIVLNSDNPVAYAQAGFRTFG